MGKTEPEPEEACASRLIAAAWLASGKPCAFAVVVPHPETGSLTLCGMINHGTMDEGMALAVRLVAGGRSIMRCFAITTCRPEVVEEVLTDLDAEVRKMSESMTSRSLIITKPDKP